MTDEQKKTLIKNLVQIEYAVGVMRGEVDPKITELHAEGVFKGIENLKKGFNISPKEYAQARAELG